MTLATSGRLAKAACSRSPSRKAVEIQLVDNLGIEMNMLSAFMVYSSSMSTCRVQNESVTNVGSISNTQHARQTGIPFTLPG